MVGAGGWRSRCDLFALCLGSAVPCVLRWADLAEGRAARSIACPQRPSTTIFPCRCAPFLAKQNSRRPPLSAMLRPFGCGSIAPGLSIAIKAARGGFERQTGDHIMATIGTFTLDRDGPLGELARVEGLAGDKGGKARIGEPFGLLAHVAVDARKGFFNELLQLSCEVTGTGARRFLVDALELGAHVFLRQRQPRGETRERALRG